MLSKRHALKAMEWAVDSPNLLLRELNRLYYTRAYRREYNPNGIDVLAADWDNLLVLDACRYDMFEKRHGLPGRLSAKESRGAHTSEFILGNFHERDLTDTVYVTASPILQRGYPHKYAPAFHEVINVWEEDGWDESQNTVLPETVVEYATEAVAEYPKKRLVVHFMQPHYPFIGSDLKLDRNRLLNPDEITTDIWNEMMTKRTDISRHEVLEAYRTNFDLVLPHVARLLETLPGKSVVTSDHGNMLGERSWPIPIVEWGHPPGIYTTELVTVPWLEYDGGPRREIVPDPPVSALDDVDDERIVERLRQLGYAE
jgi:hypothetical protein